MNYIYDPDLEFLKKCDNKHLEKLYILLIKKPGHNKKYAGSKLKRKDIHDSDRLVKELQRLGGNKVDNILFQHGSSYRQILNDIFDKFEIREKEETVEQTINNLSLGSFKPSDINDRISELNINLDILAQEETIIHYFFKDAPYKEIYNLIEHWDPNVVYNDDKTPVSNYKKSVLSKIATVSLFKHRSLRPKKSYKSPFKSALHIFNNMCQPNYRATVICCIFIALLRRMYITDSFNDISQKEKLIYKLGDHLQVAFHTVGEYTHHGIFVGYENGTGYVVHRNRNKNKVIEKVTLQEFATDFNKTIREISIVHHDKRIGSGEAIARRALRRVGEKANYRLNDNNCEHFVYEVIEGEKKCTQTEIEGIKDILQNTFGKKVYRKSIQIFKSKIPAILRDKDLAKKFYKS